MKTQVANVSRARKSEAEQAIRDLEARGYIVTFPLTEERKNGKQFVADDYKRQIFVGNTGSSKWIAKLKRVVE